MQQRRVRLGDVLDDYCPRERRITNHAVVAMIDDEVKQTRCTTCDAEHEYKHAKVPVPRRKKPGAAAAQAEPMEAPNLVAPDVIEEITDLPSETIVETVVETIEVAKEPEPAEEIEPASPVGEDEWPVHRPLIRATLPRPEGQAPERKPTDFTIRQPGGRFEERNGNRARGNKHGRHAHGQSSGSSRFGSSRSGSGHSSRQGGGHHSGNPQRQGNRQGPSSGQRGGGRPGQGGGQRSGQNRGPKRGR